MCVWAEFRDFYLKAGGVYSNRCVLNLKGPMVILRTSALNINKFYVPPTHCIYVFCIYLRTNSDLCHLQHKLIGFYNRDEKCLQRGTDWVFK